MFEGLAVFWLQDSGLDYNKKRKIVKFIIDQGFYVLRIQSLSRSGLLKQQYKLDSCEFLSQIFRESSGILIVAYDIFPLSPSSQQKVNCYQLDNARILKAKQLNTYLNEPQIVEKGDDILQSTANTQEAWTVLQIFFPHLVEQINQKIEQFQASFRTEYPVLKNLSGGLVRRAKVELIEYQQKLAIKKTFRPGCERFLRREVFVMKELSQFRPEIPSLLEHEQTFLIYPYYQDTLEFDPNHHSKIPLEVAKKCIKILDFFYQLGYALIDFQPKNLLVDEKDGLKIIDFEFLYPYKVKPKSFAQSYDIVGVPPNFDGDLPMRRLDNKRSKKIRNYQIDWQPYIGLDIDQLLLIT